MFLRPPAPGGGLAGARVLLRGGLGPGLILPERLLLELAWSELVLRRPSCSSLRPPYRPNGSGGSRRTPTRSQAPRQPRSLSTEFPAKSRQGILFCPREYVRRAEVATRATPRVRRAPPPSLPLRF